APVLASQPEESLLSATRSVSAALLLLPVSDPDPSEAPSVGSSSEPSSPGTVGVGSSLGSDVGSSLGSAEGSSVVSSSDSAASATATTRSKVVSLPASSATRYVSA